jgi:hypothetical protein
LKACKQGNDEKNSQRRHQNSVDIDAAFEFLFSPVPEYQKEDEYEY